MPGRGGPMPHVVFEGCALGLCALLVAAAWLSDWWVW